MVKFLIPLMIGLTAVSCSKEDQASWKATSSPRYIVTQKYRSEHPNWVKAGVRWEPEHDYRIFVACATGGRSVSIDKETFEKVQVGDAWPMP